MVVFPPETRCEGTDERTVATKQHRWDYHDLEDSENTSDMNKVSGG